MADFVYDGTSVPEGKTDLRPLTGDPLKHVTAVEWNTVMAAVKDLRDAILTGNYHGLISDPAATESTGTNVKVRNNAGMLQVSGATGDYHNLSEPDPGVYNVKSFGAVGDGVTDDSAAFEACIAAMTPNSWPTVRGRTMFVPQGNYYLSRTLHITRGMILCGASGGGWYAGTNLKFPAGVTGIIVDRYDTSPDFGAGDWSTIRDIGVYALGKSGTAHGIRLYARARLHSVYVTNFAGNGIHIACSSSGSIDPLTPWAPFTAYTVGQSVSNDGGKWYMCKTAGTSGNSGGPTGTSRNITTDGNIVWGAINGGLVANNWFIDYARIDNCDGHGLLVDGADANAGICIGLDASGNGGWGIYESSFLGNTYIGCHTDLNVLGPYKADDPNGRSIFIGCYAEGNQNASEVAYPSMVFGGLHGPGVTGTYGGMISDRSAPTNYYLPDDSHLMMGPGANVKELMSWTSAGGPSVTRWTYFPTTDPTVADALVWRHAGLNGHEGHGMASDRCIYKATTPNRWLSPAQLFTFPNFGLINGGFRVCHSSDPTTLTDAATRTFLVGDVVLNAAPAAGEYGGWVCTARGTNGTYSEGRTATSAGGTSLTLSAATNYRTGIHVGDRITVNATTVNVTDVSADLLTLTVSGAVPAGAGLAITYAAPTFAKFGPVVGGIPDSTGTPGAATQNTRRGRVAIAAAATNVVVTNNRVTATSVVHATLQTADATLTQVLNVIPAAGSFTITGNAAATAATNVCWTLEE